MNETPNYSTYHLNELKSALTNIDEEKKPEEAKLIRKYIQKGGYTYPIVTPIEKVNFVNKTYKWSLISIMLILLAINIYVFITWKNMSSLLPITLQSTILYLIYKNHKFARAFIKAWCILLIVSGFFRFLAMYYAPEFSISRFLNHALPFSYGLIYLIYADKCVYLVPRTCNN